MFIYLSKKIAIPNNIKLNCVAWNKEQGYIAVGGSDGLLKVLKLDAGGDNKAKGLAAPSNLSMNQTLEGHSGEVQVIVWNEIHQKLTTSDQYGLIIVWMLYKGSWYEEMINNRSKSVVKGMSWSADGQRICIVYEDGAVIVGSVDGNRIWGKEMRGTKLSAVQWAPSGKNLLFGLQSGEVHIYDNQGNYTAKLPLQFNSMIMGLNKVIVGLDWYNGKHGSGDEQWPVLALCYYSGHMQLMRYEYDESPVLVDTNMTAAACRWNHNGSILAVVGTMILPGDKNDSNVVQFFTPLGIHVRTLKVPGDTVASCAWEGGSLRVALAVDSHIYFANIRPDYKWTSINNGRVIVYSYTRPDKQGTSVCFWDTKTNETFVKQVSGLIGITAFGGFCLLALRSDDGKRFKLMLCNSISTLIDAKNIDIEPNWLAMNSTHVFVASRNNFLMWPFKTPKLYSTSHVSHKRERLYHIDDIPTGVADVIQDLDASYIPAKDTYPAADPACCMAASDKVLLVGRESGLIQHYVLPHVALAVRYSFQSRPYLMSINCDSSKFAIIDSSGILTFQTIQESSEFSIKSQIQTKSSGSQERRDVWALCWAADNPALLATMEKTRMYVLRNEEPEEPIISAGYVCCFKDLEIRSVLLDEVMKNPMQPTQEMVQDLEVKSLRDTRELLEKVGIPEATTFIEDNPHPRLWKLLAESALEKMDLKTAENAFVRFTNLQGIQFVKRLQNIHSESLRKAEIAGYRGNYDEAEKIYLEMERADLAIQLREKLGDWFRVQELMKNHGAGSDLLHEKVCNAIGDYYVERQNWGPAKEYYEKAKNVEKELICAYMLEDWDGLKRIAGKLTEKHPLLTKIGHMLGNVGMCVQAADAFVKAGDVKTAIQVCIEQSQWSEATKLAIEFQQPGVTDLLVANAKQLIDSGKVLEAIDFLCNAEQYIEAAKFMFMVADEKKKEKCEPGFLKKLYVLAAYIMEEKQKNKISELSTLLDTQSSSEALLDPWRSAEAYHFLLVAQRQLHQGYVDKAMRTAMSLVNYEDILPPEEVYCLLALTSAASHHYATCSKALCRLQALPNLSEERSEEYESLALDLFSRNSPRDPKPAVGECGACLTTIPIYSSSCPSCKTVFPICVATGVPLFNTTNVWTCSLCHHMAIPQDMALRKTCPLCHTPTSTVGS